MNRELLLLRHGKSDWSTSSDDYTRPLKKRGVKAAQKQGAELKHHNQIPDLIICSPAERAKSTMLECYSAMDQPDIDIEYDRRIYMASVAVLLQLLQEIDPSRQRVLIVGHNPGMASLVEYLVSTPIPVSKDGKRMPTATLAHFTFDCEWNQLLRACAELIQLRRP